MPLVGKNDRVTKKFADITISEGMKLGDLRKAVADALKLTDLNRIELRQYVPEAEKKKMDRKQKKGIKSYYQDSKTLGELGLKASSPIEVKDLGFQFSYRGVFFLEYLGPIVIVALYALRSPLLFGEGSTPVSFSEALTSTCAKAPAGSGEWNGFVQALAIVLWCLHFVKREFETFFVHKFSRATMPLANLFRNSTYYWGFAAAVGYPLVSPYYTAPGKEQVAVCLALWVAAQLTNYLVHAQLAGMRGTEGDKTRQPPKGFLFSLVSCPNYTAEVIGWVAWTGLTQIGMAGLFTLFGFYQMRQWAISKHVDYCDEFPEIKKRKAIVPFLI